MSNDIGTTKREGMSPRRRLKIWEDHYGVCCICHLRIDGPREPWIIEHLRPLALGGPDTDENCGPAHAACAVMKTRRDLGLIAKAKRVKQRHIGARVAKTPMPHGRNAPTKRKLDGTVVPRKKGA